MAGRCTFQSAARWRKSGDGCQPAVIGNFKAGSSGQDSSTNSGGADSPSAKQSLPRVLCVGFYLLDLYLYLYLDLYLVRYPALHLRYRSFLCCFLSLLPLLSARFFSRKAFTRAAESSSRLLSLCPSGNKITVKNLPLHCRKNLLYLLNVEIQRAGDVVSAQIFILPRSVALPALHLRYQSFHWHLMR